MTTRSSTWIRRGVLAAVAASGLALTWAFEQGSVERANRLHRTGAAVEAAALYEERLATEAPELALRYNLGTSLLAAGDPSAAEELEAASTESEGALRARALYNTGVETLRRAIDGAEGDSMRVLAERAVEVNRGALVLRPEHADTKWNLAIAQRLLDSIEAADQDAGRETAESALEADEVVQSENVLEVDEESELPEDAPRQGEDETRADAEDEDAMSLLEAEEILSGEHLDPVLLVRKLLALESRSFFGRRRGVIGPRR